MITRDSISKTRRWVVKIGSALLTAEGRGLDRGALGSWVDQMADWLEQGNELVLVSSGAVAEGMCRMGWNERPETLHELQAAAAIGQMGLVQAWESCFQRRGRHTAQVLVTHDDLSDRRRYLNARSTLQTLLSLGVVPVVNENDVVANEELRFGDNDTLAALVANLIEADLLVLLTDQDGLFDADPRTSRDARLIEHARVDDARLDGFAGDSRGNLGSGGMQTKLRAARLAARSGTATIITSGKDSEALRGIAAGKQLGTLLVPSQEPDAARKRWLAAQLQAHGQLILDAGAVNKLQHAGSSLLAVGVTAVDGRFSRGEMVLCLDPQGREVARGLVNYSSEEARKIAGRPSQEFEQILGYMDDEELIHRDNLVVL
ncbi:glutamate 5-kinase [Thiolapillus sp.]|uniref:glutamate 5-kinase n=1 Tax=Thiolapillus sp. TaxID=2017437 RepID=UPI0025D7D1F2|nr:glutamate 5-kinase [Thiolapillus sp.]